MTGAIYFERPENFVQGQTTLDGEMWIECDGMYMLVDADWATRCKDEDGDRC